MDPACWLKKGSRFSKPSTWGNFSVSPTWSTRPTTGWGERSTSLWVRGNLLWQPPMIRKLACFGHVTSYDSLSKTILRGTMEGGRRLGRQKKCWMPLPELLTMASWRKDQKKIPAESSLMPPHPPPTTQSIKGLNLNWTIPSNFEQHSVLTIRNEEGPATGWDNLVSRRFESSQSQRITSGLNINFTLSPSYSFYKSSRHKSCFFPAYLYSVGTQHGNLHPAGWAILFCGPTQEPCVSHSKHRINRERFGKDAGE